ncbi:MAG: FG-GAP repeat protein, partial [Planctomycetales bacterium]|nr:FG-GAP repeat protein [Planctomycetales bacterium]
WGNILAISDGNGLIRTAELNLISKRAGIGAVPNSATTPRQLAGKLPVELVVTNWGRSILAADAGKNVWLDLNGRVRDEIANPEFLGRKIIAGSDVAGDVDIALGPVFKQTTADPSLSSNAAVALYVCTVEACDPLPTPTDVVAASSTVDHRYFPDPNSGTWLPVDAAFRFNKIEGDNITLVSTMANDATPATEKDLSIIARTDVRDLSTTPNDLRVITKGDITIKERGTMPIDEIIGYYGDVDLTAMGVNASILDVAGNDPSTAYLKADSLTLRASNQIGEPTDFLEIDSSFRQPGVVRAYANQGIYLREVDGHMNIDAIASDFWDVALETIGGSILEPNNDNLADIQARNIDLKSSLSIGDPSNPIEINGAGIGQRQNGDFRITTAVPANGRLYASAQTNVALTEMNGALNVLKAQGNSGDVILQVHETVLVDTAFEGPYGEDLVLDAAGGVSIFGDSVSSGVIQAGNNIELTVGDDLIQPAGTSINAFGTLIISADDSPEDPDRFSGANVDLFGSVKAITAIINSGDDLDFINLASPGGLDATVILGTGDADDRIFVQAVRNGQSLLIDGGVGADRYYISSDAEKSLFSTQGFFDDTFLDPASLLNETLNGTLGGINGFISIETGGGGNQATRDKIFVSSHGSSTPLTGTLSSQTISGLGMSGEISFFAPDSAEVFLRLGQSNDSFHVKDLAAPYVVQISGDQGDDSFTVKSDASANWLSGISGIVMFSGDQGDDSLWVQGDGSTDPGLLTAVSVTGLGMGDNALFTDHDDFGANVNASCVATTSCPGAIYFGQRRGFANDYVSTIETVTVKLSDNADVLNVDSVDSFGTRSVLGGAGNDTLTVGSTALQGGLYPNADRLDYIEGNLRLDGEGGYDSIVVNDSGDDNPNLGALVGDTVVGLDMPGSVTVISADDLRIRLGGGSDTFYVPSTNANQQVQLEFGQGKDTAYIGSQFAKPETGSLDGILGQLFLLGLGPDSGDTLYLNDFDAASGKSYQVQNDGAASNDVTTVRRTFEPPFVVYQQFETVVFNTGRGDDQINLYSTHREQAAEGKSASFFVNTGEGDDQVLLGRPITETSYSLDTFEITTDGSPSGIPVFINGGAGNDAVHYRDNANAASTTLAFGQSAFSELFPAEPTDEQLEQYAALLGLDVNSATFLSVALAHGGIVAPVNIGEFETESAEVSLGDGDDVLLLRSGNYSRNLIFNGGGGTDTATVQNAVNLQGNTFTMNGQDGNDLLYVDFSMASLVDQGTLAGTLIGITTNSEDIPPNFLEFQRGDYFVETRDNAGVWQFRIVDELGAPVTIATADGQDRTNDWQAIIPTFDTRRGIVLQFGTDPANFSQASFGDDVTPRTAARIAVGTPDRGTSIVFNAGADTDTLRVAGDGDVSFSVYTPDASVPGAGSLSMDGNLIEFTGVEPFLVYGLPDLQLRSVGDVPVDLTVDAGAVSPTSIPSVTLHTLVIDGVVSWVPQPKFQFDPAADADRYGKAIAMDGNTLVVGSQLDLNLSQDPDDVAAQKAAGVVFVYTWDDQLGWVEQAKLAPSDRRFGGGGGFGSSVDIQGDTLIVGAHWDGAGTGSAYVYTRQPSGGWSQQTKLTPSDQVAAGHFGYSVGVQDNLAIVGRPGANETGDLNEAVFFYGRQGTTWSESTVLSGSGDFGRSVAIALNRAAIGAPATGSVQVIQTGAWTNEAILTASDPQSGERFGDSVAMTADQIVVGAPNWDATRSGSLIVDQGRAFVFQRNGGTGWTREARLTAHDGLPITESNEGKAGDHFGFHVATDGTYVVVGAPDVDLAVIDGGAAYVYYRLPAAGGLEATWTRSSGTSGSGQISLGTDAAEDNTFGKAVGVAGGRIVVGIPGYHAPQRNDVGSIQTYAAGTLPAETLESLRAEQIQLSVTPVAGTAVTRTVYEPNSRTLFVADPDALFVEPGAPNGTPATPGVIYTFINEGIYWRPTGTLSRPANHLEFGTSMAVLGDTLVVGSPGSNNVSIYKRSGESWVKTAQELTGQGRFGSAVAINSNGTRIAVGEPQANVGYRYGEYAPSNAYMNLSTPGDSVIFELQNGTWNRARRLMPEDTVNRYPLSSTISTLHQVTSYATVYAHPNFTGEIHYLNGGKREGLGQANDVGSAVKLGPMSVLILEDSDTGRRIMMYNSDRTSSQSYSFGSEFEDFFDDNMDVGWLINSADLTRTNWSNFTVQRNSDYSKSSDSLSIQNKYISYTYRHRWVDSSRDGKSAWIPVYEIFLGFDPSGGQPSGVNMPFDQIYGGLGAVIRNIVDPDRINVAGNYLSNVTKGVPYNSVLNNYSNVAGGQWGSSLAFINPDTLYVGAPGDGTVGNSGSFSAYGLYDSNTNGIQINLEPTSGGPLRPAWRN